MKCDIKHGIWELLGGKQLIETQILAAILNVNVWMLHEKVTTIMYLYTISEFGFQKAGVAHIVWTFIFI